MGDLVALGEFRTTSSRMPTLRHDVLSFAFGGVKSESEDGGGRFFVVRVSLGGS